MMRGVNESGRALLRDENGQTMLEYVVIIIFVVVAAIIAFRIFAGIIIRGSRRASASIGI